jgi:hypothetical protein
MEEMIFSTLFASAKFPCISMELSFQFYYDLILKLKDNKGKNNIVYNSIVCPETFLMSQSKKCMNAFLSSWACSLFLFSSFKAEKY